jgi:hypothetical protein
MRGTQKDLEWQGSNLIFFFPLPIKINLVVREATCGT